MKLEEDIQNSLAIVQALSRQLEKLGVRFRVTRRTLRDPIQATAVLSQKTSEVVNALAQREDMLENELQEIQQVLLAMQDQQAKQLNLIAATVGKTLKGQRDFETKMERNLHRSGIGPSTRSVRTAQNLDSKNSRGSVVDEGNNVIQGLGDFGIGIIRKGAVKPNIERNASVGGKQTQDAGTSHRYESIQGKGPLNGASSTEVKSTRPKPEPSTRLSEPSLSKVDFWAEPIAPSAGLPSSLPLAQYSPTSSEKVDDAQSSASSSSNRLGTFFSSRKKMSGSQDPRASNY